MFWEIYALIIVASIIIELIVIVVMVVQDLSAKYIKEVDSKTKDFNRVITVYDYCGNVIKKHEGKCDIQESDNGKVLFDLAGKRNTIYNAIVIVEEEYF